MNELKPLFIRVAATEADRLDRASTETGQSKRRLVEDAMRSYLDRDDLVVGHASLNERAPEVLVPGEAAAFLQLDEDALLRAAAAGEIPAGQIGGDWRFSRTALLGWLAGSDPSDAT